MKSTGNGFRAMSYMYIFVGGGGGGMVGMGGTS